MTNLNAYKFGVEIEFTGATTQTVADEMQTLLAGTGIAVYREGYNHSTRNHWKVTTDATVTENRNYRDGSGYGGELVSPVLHGEAGLAELKAVLDALNEVDGRAVRVDRRCGVHVHLSWDGMTTDHVKEVYKRYAQYEADIDAWMAPSRRGNNSRWCASIATNNSQGLRDVAAHTGTLSGMANLCGRYYKVNLQSLSRYGTVEFRQHGGSTEFEKIGAWVKFLMGFVEASKTTRTGTDITTYKRAKRQGNAFGEVRELFAQKGWEVAYAGRGNWKVVDPIGNTQDTLTGEQMFAFYVDGACNYETGNLTRNARATMTQEFVAYYQNLIGDVQVADTLFEGVDQETQDYLMARVAHFGATRRAA